jgi:hypothetical protein
MERKNRTVRVRNLIERRDNAMKDKDVMIQKLITEFKEKIHEVERRARARTISKDEDYLNRIVETIKNNPTGGIIEGDGGAVSNSYAYRAETTFFSVAWYWSKIRSTYEISVYRDRTSQVPHGRGWLFYYEDRKTAWKKLYAKRYDLLKKKLGERRIKKLSLPMLEGLEETGEICGGLVLAKTIYRKENINYSSVYLGTPEKWYKLPDKISSKFSILENIEKVNPWTVLWWMGFRKRKRKWTPEISKELTVFFVTGELTGWKA